MSSFAFSQDIVAKTRDGRAVILRKKGGWFFYDPSIDSKQREDVPEQGLMATTLGGQVFILRKDGTWNLVSSSVERTQSSNPEQLNPKVMQLIKSGYSNTEYWEIHKSMLGKKAPELELFNWMNGSVPQETWMGKIVVVVFWATWCSPCRASIPRNNTLFQKYKDQGVVFIGACCSRGQEKIMEVIKQSGLKYPTATVSDFYVKIWNVFYWPTYAIVDRAGNLQAIGVDPDYVEPIIQALLEK